VHLPRQVIRLGAGQRNGRSVLILCAQNQAGRAHADQTGKGRFLRRRWNGLEICDFLEKCYSESRSAGGETRAGGRRYAAAVAAGLALLAADFAAAAGLGHPNSPFRTLSN